MEKCPVLNKFHNKKHQRQFSSHFTSNDEKKKHQQLTKHSNKGLVKRPAPVEIVGLHIRTFWGKSDDIN